jgi:hypothetical protein
MDLPFLFGPLHRTFPRRVYCFPKGEEMLTFWELNSRCIDLGHYDAKTRQLTVRFVNPNPMCFYRYSKIPPDIWRNIKRLSETEGLGTYFNETVVQHREKYPFEERGIRHFKIHRGKEKAGDSK